MLSAVVQLVQPVQLPVAVSSHAGRDRAAFADLCAAGHAAAADHAAAAGRGESPSIPPTSATPSDSGYQRISPSATPPATNTPPTGRVVQPPAAAPAVAPVPPPAVKLDRIVSLPAHNAVQGVVVQADDKPRPSAKLLFVNDKKLGTQQPVTADPAGKFNVDLAPGTWLIYLAGTDGKLIYHSKLDVQGEGNRPVMLVSR